MKRIALIALLSFALLPWAVAGQKIDLTRPVDPDGTVSIEIGSGTLRVIGWNRNEVRIVGTVPEGEDMFEVNSGDGDISIEAALPDTDCDGCDEDDRGRHRHGKEYRRLGGESADLEIHVPRGSELDIEAISCKLTVEDVEGMVSVEAISGNVDFTGSVKEFEISVVSGTVKVVNEGRLEEGDIEAVSGDIDIKTRLGRDASLDIESVSGGVTLRLPSDTQAKFSIETFSGSIKNEFGPAAKKSSSFLPAMSLQFSIGGSPESEVNIECFSGAVSLLKED